MGEHARILVVDDDEGVRKTLESILEAKGYNVDTAENGREAIRKSHENLYDLALVDIRLPDIEGTKLLTKLREKFPRTVKIILTGFPAMRNAIEAVNNCADGYLMKPVDIDHLLKTIETHLGRRRAEEKYGQEATAAFIETRLRE